MRVKTRRQVEMEGLTERVTALCEDVQARRDRRMGTSVQTARRLWWRPPPRVVRRPSRSPARVGLELAHLQRQWLEG